MIQQSLWSARAARDAGIEQTRTKNAEWMERALQMLPAMRHEGCVLTTGEGMRIWLLLKGLEEPSSPNAWGAMVRLAMSRGLIRDTGRVVQMVTEKSHARRTPLWEIL
jgi:hypothetical protein